MYLLPGEAFPISSGNGEWGQFLTIFAIPLAAAQVTAWYRTGRPSLRWLAWAVVVAQLTLVSSWAVIWWHTQSARDPTENVGQVLGAPTELERALLARVRADRDRVLLAPLAEERILRRVDFGHGSSFARLGIPLVNGWFKFVSYHTVYPDPDATWGTIQTHGEELRPDMLDVAGVSLLVTLDDERPSDASLRYVGQYSGRQAASFQVWQNLDVWPRVSFVDGPFDQPGNPEAGVVLWRRRLLPTRRPDAVTYDMTHPGRYSITFDPAPSDRFLLISDVARPDLLTVHGATLMRSGPLSDAFTILKVPAGARTVQATWEDPLRRWLWLLSYLTFALGAIACAVFWSHGR